MSTRKILAFSGIRSDYDLMSGLYKTLHSHENFEIKLIVSGAHLSETYGYTVKNIEEDGLPILARIESLIDSNSSSSRLKSMSILLQSVIPLIENYNPDVIIYPGDREDVMVGALVGSYIKVPTLHFFGGDHATDGNVDNPIRHATSKLSSIHFVTNGESKNRLIRMGESEKRIYNVGSPALDKFITTRWIKKEFLLEEFNREEWSNYALVVFHPLLGEEEFAGQYFEEILLTLKEEKIKAFVSYPNVDSGNRKIIKIIEKYSNDNDFIFYKNLSRDYFINILRHARFMIGNSSAGLYEAPIVPLGVVNVGNRQKGRYCGDNIIFVSQGKKNIKTGIRKILSNNFQEQLKMCISPYGEGKSIKEIIRIFEVTNFEDYIYKYEDPLTLEEYK